MAARLAGMDDGSPQPTEHRFQVPDRITAPPTLSTNITRRPKRWVAIVGGILLAVGVLGAIGNVWSWVRGDTIKYASQLEASFGIGVAVVVQLAFILGGSFMVRSAIQDRRRVRDLTKS